MDWLTRLDPPGAVSGLALLLHGGQETSHDPVLRRHGGYARMALMQRTLAARLRRRGVAVWLLRNQVRGWNAAPGREPDPVRDARAALSAAAATLPGIPTVLVGHSMGGRTACALAAHERVVGVCALAPWLPAGTPVAPLGGKVLVVAHGTADTRTSARASREFTDRARSAGCDATYVEIPGAGHAMLRPLVAWDQVVRRATLGMLGLDEVGR